MTDAMHSKVVLKYNGNDEDSLTDRHSSFSFTDNASGEADSVTISFQNIAGEWMKGYYPKSGDYLKAWIKAEHWQYDNVSEKLYCGKFLIDTIEISGFPQTTQVQGISVPIKTGFNVTQRNRTWKKTNTKSILSDLAKNGGIKIVYDAKIHDIDEIRQSGKTDLTFAFGICADYGLSIKLYNDKMIVYDQTEYEKKKAAYTIRKDNLCGGYKFKVQITKVYDSVKIQYTKNKQTFTYSYTVPGKKGNRTLFINSKVDSYKEAETKAKAKLRENLRKNKSLTLNLTGMARYRAAENFRLEGFGKLDGVYFIDAVVHNKSHTAWKSTITAHPVVTDF